MNIKDQMQLKKTLEGDKVISSIKKLMTQSQDKQIELSERDKILKEEHAGIDKQVKDLEHELETIIDETKQAERTYQRQRAELKASGDSKEKQFNIKAQEKDLKKTYEQSIKALDGSRTTATKNRGEKGQQRFQKQEELKKN